MMVLRSFRVYTIKSYNCFAIQNMSNKQKWFNHQKSIWHLPWAAVDSVDNTGKVIYNLVRKTEGSTQKRNAKLDDSDYCARFQGYGVSTKKWEALRGFYGAVVFNPACTLESSGSLLKIVIARSYPSSIRTKNLRTGYGYLALIFTFLG